METMNENYLEKKKNFQKELKKTVNRIKRTIGKMKYKRNKDLLENKWKKKEGADE